MEADTGRALADAEKDRVIKCNSFMNEQKNFKKNQKGMGYGFV